MGFSCLFVHTFDYVLHVPLIVSLMEVLPFGNSWTHCYRSLWRIESFNLIQKAVTNICGRTVHLRLLTTKADNPQFAEFCKHKLLWNDRVYWKRNNIVCWFCFSCSFAVIGLCQIQNTKLSGCFELLVLGSYGMQRWKIVCLGFFRLLKLFLMIN